MKKIHFMLVLFLIPVAIVAAGSASTGTPASANVRASNFVNSVGPNKVWDATGTDSNWFAGVPAPLAVFGPGINNSTVYAYGVALTGTSSPYSGATVTARSINATLVSSSKDTKEASVISDTQATFIDEIQDTPSVCVGYGSLGVVYTSSDGTNSQLHFALATGSTVTTTSITSATPPNNTVYNFLDHQCWYDPVGIYYVAWTTQTVTTSGGSTTYSETAVSVQGIHSTTIKTIWSKESSVALTNPSVSLSGYGYGYTNLVAGGSNSTNSSTIYLAYLVLTTEAESAYTASQTATLSLTPITVTASSGSVGTTKSAITTNNPTATVGSSTFSYTYAPAGIVSSNNIDGLVISLSNSSSSFFSETYLFYNISNGALQTSNFVSDPSGYTALTYGEGSQFGAMGWTSGQGYGIAFIFQKSGRLFYVYETYYQNGAVNVTIPVGSVPVSSSDFTSSYPANFFVDANGALWFGYTLYDNSTAANDATVGNAIQGYIGKLVAGNYPISTTNANSNEPSPTSCEPGYYYQPSLKTCLSKIYHNFFFLH